MTQNDLVLIEAEVSLPPSEQSYIERHLNKAAKLMKKFRASDGPILTCMIKDDGHGNFRSSVTAHLKIEPLHAEKVDRAVLLSARHAVDAVLAQYAKYRLEHMRHLRDKKDAHKIPESNKPSSIQSALLSKPEQMRKRIEQVYRSLHFEVALEVLRLNVDQDFDIANIDIDEMIDDVLLAHMNEFEEDDVDLVKMRESLAQEVIKRIEHAIEQGVEEREQRVSTESGVSELTDREQQITLGDELLNFWVVEERLKLEDFIADPRELTPESISLDERPSLKVALMSWVNKLPLDLRQIFTASVLEGLSIHELEQYFKKTEAELKEKLEQAWSKVVSVATQSYLPGPTREFLEGLYQKLRHKWHEVIERKLK